MYNEDDHLMLSALQHYLFCPRQCALIHVELQKRGRIYLLSICGILSAEKSRY